MPEPDSNTAGGSTQPYNTSSTDGNSPQVMQSNLNSQIGSPFSVNQPQTKSPKTLKRIGIFILVELVEFGYSYAVGHGRIQDVLAWITSSQIAIILIIVLIVWAAKHKDKYYQSTGSVPSLNRSGKIRIILGTFVIIALVVGWAMGVFPALIKLSLKNDGVDAVASVQSYELVGQGSRGAEFNASSVSQADALNVKLSYNNRTSTISIQKGDPAFSQVYGAATQTGDEVPVRYLRLIPAIVLPKSDLGLPNSANTKPSYSSSTVPIVKTPQVSQVEISNAITMANQYLADLQQNNFQAAENLETPFYQNKYSVTYLQNQYQSMGITGYTGTLIGTGTGVSPGGYTYIDLLYKYIQPNNPTPYYVKVWIENDSKWGIGLLGSSLNLQYLNTPDIKLNSP
jgi:hypothetical protein